jgi:hypothetical protein
MTIASDTALAETLIEKGNVDEAEELIASIEKAVKTKTHQLDEDEDDDDDIEDDWSGVKKRHRFEAFVDAIANEENVPKPVAMTRARQRHPELHASYQRHIGVAKSYGAALRVEINKGCSPVVAAQRVAVLYPGLAQERFAKSADDVADFMELVDAYRAEHGCDTTVAMSAMRKRYPDAFDRLQRA